MLPTTWDANLKNNPMMEKQSSPPKDKPVGLLDAHIPQLVASEAASAPRLR